MKISIITAMDRNRCIGSGMTLPWHLPADLAIFKKTTQNHTVIMGRKTFESIGKALPNRYNLVISRNPKYRLPFDENDGALFCSLEDAFHFCRKMSNPSKSEHPPKQSDRVPKKLKYHIPQNIYFDEVFVIGGEELYKMTVQHAERIYISKIYAEFTGDRFFPEINWDEWRMIEREKFPKNEKNQYDFEHCIYEKKVNKNKI
jgi:dihydrofolate reductase